MRPDDYVLQHPAPWIKTRRADHDVKGQEVFLAWTSVTGGRCLVPGGQGGDTPHGCLSGEDLFQPIIKALLYLASGARDLASRWP
jgi:hypothetical protein